jgi:5'-nucleotidase
VPAEDVQGYRITTLGRRKYSDSLRRDQDPAGHEFFWIGGGTTRWKGRPDSDFRAVESGCISITPMHLDLTNFELIEEVSRWPLKP